MKKLRALVTAEVVSSILEEKLGDRIDFIYDGYYLDHDVMNHQELIEKVKDIDILICEYDTIDAQVFDAASNLKIIICCRGGVKTVIDLEKAMENGIIVCNNGGRNAGAVTDMAMGYILDLTRNITLSNNLIHSKTITADLSSKPEEYRDTVWGLDKNSPFIKYRGRSINHMNLGIVGFGFAGRLMASKASAFGMHILAYDPYSSFENTPDYVEPCDWDRLLSESDIISVHCTLSPQTKNMFSKKVFDRMKDDAYFINTARGELVVEEDLIDALNSGKLAGAAIDVTRKEPISSDSPLVGTKNLLITPHIAGSADDVQICGTNMVVESLSDYINGKKPRNAVVYR
ncbi:MAG: hypothetical protein IJW19_03560 [Clostridia bacterium]|nr:hypothetical protein [Clostridia bacterium]